MTLSLTDDASCVALNKKYAGEDHVTDVLSFEQEAPLLGDVIISVETAARQAKAANAFAVGRAVPSGGARACVHLMRLRPRDQAPRSA